MADYATILYDTGALPVLRLVLNRPDKRNPLGPQVFGELVHALGRAGADDAVRCVVITGAGKVFSAGGDLGGMAAVAGGPPPASLVELFTTMHGRASRSSRWSTATPSPAGWG
jgi:enoyl-CoA hydratase/carnithine racemase